MELPYTVESFFRGDRYGLRIKELPGCEIERDAPAETLSQRLEEAKRKWISEALEKGKQIPEPEDGKHHQKSSGNEGTTSVGVEPPDPSDPNEVGRDDSWWSAEDQANLIRYFEAHSEEAQVDPFPNPETRLANLSEQELARLLNLTPQEARQRLQGYVLDPLMHFSVGKVRQWIENGVLYEFRPHLHVPKDVGARWRILRGLLAEDPEFETRYPEAHKVLVEPALGTKKEFSGLPLPSFGIRVLRSDPKTYVRPYPEPELGPVNMVPEPGPQETEDAYSSTFSRKELGEPPVDQGFMPLGSGYLRGTLLAILSREEYWERIFVRHRDPDLLEGVVAPYYPDMLGGFETRYGSPIRLTDLRLALTLKQVKSEELRSKLKRILDSLEAPITARNVLWWKLQTIYRSTELLEHEFGSRNLGVVATSFTAAALFLFLDYDMPGVRDAKPYRLAEQVQTLASAVIDLADALDNATNNLEALLANRAKGNQPRLDNHYLLALHLHRMGHRREYIAQRLGITPYSSKTGKGTKDWKKRVSEKIDHGKQVEKTLFPRATEIFANRDNPYVQDKARLAYSSYKQYVVEERSGDIPWTWIGERIKVDVRRRRGLEIASAYIQLGCYLAHDRDPLP